MPPLAPRYPQRLFRLIEELDDERATSAEVVRRVGEAAWREGLIRPSPPHVRRLVARQRRRRADDREVLREALAALSDLAAGHPAGYHILERLDRARERVEERERRHSLL